VSSCYECFSEITLLKTYIRWLNFVVYRQNMSAISFVPLNDLLKLMKTPGRLRIGFGENNYYYLTHIQERFFELRFLNYTLMVKESGDSNRSEDKIEMINKFPKNVFFRKVDEHIVHPLGFGWWRRWFHGRCNKINDLCRNKTIQSR